MKFIYFTDAHICDKLPAFRKDENYLETCLTKLMQVVQLANKHKCSLIHGGDLFDKYSPSDTVSHAVFTLLQGLQGKFYTAIGNHDIVGQRIENVWQGRLSALSLMPNVVFSEKQIHSVKIEGQKFTFINYFRKPLRKHLLGHGDSIIVTHNYFVPRYIEDKAYNKHLEIEDNPKIKSKLVLIGHYHNDFSYKHKGTLYINPGSMMRAECTAENQKREPKVLLIDNFDIYEIKLQCEENPFRSNDKEKQREWHTHIDKFVEALGNVKLELGLTLKDRLENLKLNLKQNKIPKELKNYISNEALDELIRRLHNAR